MCLVEVQNPMSVENKANKYNRKGQSAKQGKKLSHTLISFTPETKIPWIIEMPDQNWLSWLGDIHTKALNTLKKSHRITNHLHFNLSHVSFQLLSASSFRAATKPWHKWAEFHLLFLKPLEQKCQTLVAPWNTPSNPSQNQSLLIFY